MEEKTIMNSAVADAMQTLKGDEQPVVETKQEPKEIVTGMIMDQVETTKEEVDIEQTPAQQQIAKDAITGQQLERLLRAQKKRPMVREYDKIGRNDECPCGSGKKYKNCCLSTGKYEHLKVAR